MYSVWSENKNYKFFLLEKTSRITLPNTPTSQNKEIVSHMANQQKR